MTKKNPLRGWYSDLFGSRGADVGAALEYVDQLATASTDAVAVQTAARVLLNTVIGAVDQILSSPSPERLALIELINDQITIRLRQEGSISDQIDEWFRENLDIDDRINDWLSNNFDVTDYNFNDAVNDWMGDNLEDKINDLDLVVRIR